MNTLEDRLRQSMEQGARSVDVPSPPDLRPVAEHRQRRRRGAIAVLGSVAAVAAIVAGVMVIDRPGAEAPPAGPGRVVRTLNDLPKGELPQVPYVVDGLLHQPTGTLDTGVPIDDLVSGGEELLLHDKSGWHDPDGSLSIPDPVGRPAISPDGKIAVWAELSSRRTLDVVAWALRDGREISRLGLGLGLRPRFSFQLLGIDSGHHVYLREASDDGRYRIWMPESERSRRLLEPASGGEITQVTPRGALWINSGGTSMVATYDDNGEPADLNGIPHLTHFSPTGDLGIGPDLDIYPVPVSGRIVHLQLHDDLSAEVAAFESDEAVLVRLRQGTARAIARCGVDTGACELAAMLPPEGNVVFPITRPVVTGPGDNAPDFEAHGGQLYDVPELEGYLPAPVSWPTAPEGHRAQLGGGDGATDFPLLRVARSSDGGQTWSVFDFREQVITVDPFAVVLPDGRLMAVELRSDQTDTQPPYQEQHRIVASAGDDWSRIEPISTSFSPRLTREEVPRQIAISTDGRHVGIRTNLGRVFLSDDAGTTFAHAPGEGWPAD